MKKIFYSFMLVLLLTPAFSQINLDTSIVNRISQIDSANIRNDIQLLQNYVTRYKLDTNHRRVAAYVKQKFVSNGYNNTLMDSVFYMNTWQYNIIATLSSPTPTNDYIVIGAHYDSYCNSNLTKAPGADDNASSVASIFEIARILKNTNYQPKVNIIFLGIAAEEASNGESCIDFINKYNDGIKNIKTYINLDMIAYSTQTADTLKIQKYPNSEWISNIVSELCPLYTPLAVKVSNDDLGGSSSSTFGDENIPTTFFQENEFNPYWHSINDKIIHCNIPYCTNITKVAAALLLYLDKHLPVVNLDAQSMQNKIQISWPKNNSNCFGYNLYRASTLNGNYQKLNSAVLQDTSFTDNTITNNVYYYYTATAILSQNQESVHGNIDSAMGLQLLPGILVVDDSNGGLLNPNDSTVDAFYNSLLSGYEYFNFDANGLNTIDLSLIGNYTSVFWHVENAQASGLLYNSKNEIKEYLKAGGNLFLTSDKLSYAVERNTILNINYSSHTFFNEYLKIDSVSKKSAARFIGAVPLEASFDSLLIDTLKTPILDQHHIGNVEAIYPSNAGLPIYSYYSKYASNTTQGAMTGLPIGVSYIGSDYKTVTLSFPLFYMNIDEAKMLTNHVLTGIFSEINTGVTEDYKTNNNSIKVFPNPASENLVIEFFLNKTSSVQIIVKDNLGRICYSNNAGYMPAGYTSFDLVLKDFAEGVFYVNVITGTTGFSMETYLNYQ